MGETINIIVTEGEYIAIFVVKTGLPIALVYFFGKPH